MTTRKTFDRRIFFVLGVPGPSQLIATSYKAEESQDP